MRGSIHGVLLLAAGLALPVAGQVQGRLAANVELGNSAHVARLPYTAEYKITRVRTLSDGSTITQESTELVAHDSQGRRMTSTTTTPVSGDQTPQMSRTHVMVFDPVAHTNINWSTPGQKATVMAMSSPLAGRGCQSTALASSPSAVTARPKPTVEDLGIETIQGIEAHGRRTTWTTPAGTIGNSEPLVHTTELWMATAPGLRGLVAREVNDDPQSGKMTRELMNFSQAEPDASAFQPPAGYEIENKEVPVPACAGTEGAEQRTAPIQSPPPVQ
ncbi:MAG: hypothetical protein ABSE51_18710 [Terracidiphilus sp.]|jgi:hypothetical protein